MEDGKEVIDETKLAEGVTQADIDAASKLVEALPDDGGDESTKTDLQELINKAQELFHVAAINTAIKGNDAAALQAIIVDMKIELYIKLPRAQRGEVVEYLIATTEEAFKTVDEFKTAVGSAITAYQTLLSDVNGATEKTSMVEKLGAIKYDAFDNLTAVQKLDVAEEILAMVTAEGDDKVKFETLAQIRAAVDAVMVELGY